MAGASLTRLSGPAAPAAPNPGGTHMSSPPVWRPCHPGVRGSLHAPQCQPRLGPGPGALMGWEDTDGQSVIQHPALPGVWPGAGCGDPDGFRYQVTAVPLGEPSHAGPRGEESPPCSSVLGPSLAPGETEGQHSPGTRLSASGHRRGRHQCAAGWLGVCQRCGGEGGAKERLFFPIIAGTQVPWLPPCLGHGEHQPGRRKGQGRCALCPPPSGAGDCSRQQGQLFDTHILYSCKQHKSAWLLFP